MARVPKWVLNAVIWADLTAQASQFADDPNPHRKPNVALGDFDINSLITDYLSLSDLNTQIPSKTIVLSDATLGYAATLIKLVNAQNAFYTSLYTLGFSASGPTNVAANMTPMTFNDLTNSKIESIINISIGKPSGFAGDSGLAVYLGDDGRFFGGFGTGPTILPTSLFSKFNQSTVDPTTSDIPSGFCTTWKNTSTGIVSLWANDGGTMKKASLA